MDRWGSAGGPLGGPASVGSTGRMKAIDIWASRQRGASASGGGSLRNISPVRKRVEPRIEPPTPSRFDEHGDIALLHARIDAVEAMTFGSREKSDELSILKGQIHAVEREASRAVVVAEETAADLFGRFRDDILSQVSRLVDDALGGRASPAPTRRQNIPQTRNRRGSGVGWDKEQSTPLIRGSAAWPESEEEERTNAQEQRLKNLEMVMEQQLKRMNELQDKIDLCAAGLEASSPNEQSIREIVAEQVRPELEKISRLEDVVQQLSAAAEPVAMRSIASVTTMPGDVSKADVVEEVHQQLSARLPQVVNSQVSAAVASAVRGQLENVLTSDIPVLVVSKVQSEIHSQVPDLVRNEVTTHLADNPNLLAHPSRSPGVTPNSSIASKQDLVEAVGGSISSQVKEEVHSVLPIQVESIKAQIRSEMREEVKEQVQQQSLEANLRTMTPMHSRMTAEGSLQTQVEALQSKVDFDVPSQLQQVRNDVAGQLGQRLADVERSIRTVSQFGLQTIAPASRARDEEQSKLKMQQIEHSMQDQVRALKNEIRAELRDQINLELPSHVQKSVSMHAPPASPLTPLESRMDIETHLNNLQSTIPGQVRSQVRQLQSEVQQEIRDMVSQQLAAEIPLQVQKSVNTHPSVAALQSQIPSTIDRDSQFQSQINQLQHTLPGQIQSHIQGALPSQIQSQVQSQLQTALPGIQQQIKSDLQTQLQQEIPSQVQRFNSAQQIHTPMQSRAQPQEPDAELRNQISTLEGKLPNQIQSQIQSQLQASLPGHVSQIQAQIQGEMQGVIRSQVQNQLELEVPGHVQKSVSMHPSISQFTPLQSQVNQLQQSQAPTDEIAKLQSQVPGQVKSQVQSMVPAEVQSQVKLQLQSQLPAQVFSQLENQLPTQVASLVHGALQSQLPVQLKSQLRSELQTRDSTLPPESVQDPIAMESAVQTQVQTELQSVLPTQVQSVVYSQLQTQLPSHVQAEVESQVQSQVPAVVQSQLNQASSQIQSQLKSQLTAQMQSQVQSALKSALPTLQSQLQSQLPSQLKSVLQNQVANQVKSQMSAEIGPQMQKIARLESTIEGLQDQSRVSSVGDEEVSRNVEKLAERVQGLEMSSVWQPPPPPPSQPADVVGARELQTLNERMAEMEEELKAKDTMGKEVTDLATRLASMEAAPQATELERNLNRRIDEIVDNQSRASTIVGRFDSMEASASAAGLKRRMDVLEVQGNRVAELQSVNKSLVQRLSALESAPQQQDMKRRLDELADTKGMVSVLSARLDTVEEVTAVAKMEREVSRYVSEGVYPVSSKVETIEKQLGEVERRMTQRLDQVSGAKMNTTTIAARLDNLDASLSACLGLQKRIEEIDRTTVKLSTIDDRLIPRVKAVEETLIPRIISLEGHIPKVLNLEDQIPRLAAMEEQIMPRIKSIEEQILQRLTATEDRILPRLKDVEAEIPKVRLFFESQLPTMKANEEALRSKIKGVEDNIVPKMRSMESQILPKIRASEDHLSQKMLGLEERVLPRVQQLEEHSIKNFESQLSVKTLDEQIGSQVNQLEERLLPRIQGVEISLSKASDEGLSDVMKQVSRRVSVIEDESRRHSEAGEEVSRRVSQIDEVGRKVSRLEDEVSRSATLLEGAVRPLASRVAGVEESLQPLTSRLSGVEGNMRPLISRVSGIEDTVQPLTSRVSGVEHVVSGIEHVVQPLETRVSGVEHAMQPLESRVSGVEHAVQPLESRVSGVEHAVQPLESRVSGVEHAVQPLESRVLGVEHAVQPLMSRVSGVEDVVRSAVSEPEFRSVRESVRLIEQHVDRMSLPENVGPRVSLIEESIRELESASRLVAVESAIAGLQEKASVAVDPNEQKIDELCETIRTIEQELPRLQHVQSQLSEVEAQLPSRVQDVEEALSGKMAAVEQSVMPWVKSIEEQILPWVSSVEQHVIPRIKSLEDHALDTRLKAIEESLMPRVKSIEDTLPGVEKLGPKMKGVEKKVVAVQEVPQKLKLVEDMVKPLVKVVEEQVLPRLSAVEGAMPDLKGILNSISALRKEAAGKGNGDLGAAVQRLQSGLVAVAAQQEKTKEECLIICSTLQNELRGATGTPHHSQSRQAQGPFQQALHTQSRLSPTRRM